MHAQMGRRLAITAALALELCARQVAGHGAMTFPRPRNALDGDLAPWTNWSYPCDSTHQEKMCAVSFCCGGQDCQGSCSKSAHNGIKGSLDGSNGQACYYFSVRVQSLARRSAAPVRPPAPSSATIVAAVHRG
jgi:hypothetical protein